MFLITSHLHRAHPIELMILGRVFLIRGNDQLPLCPVDAVLRLRHCNHADVWTAAQVHDVPTNERVVMEAQLRVLQARTVCFSF